jgi:small subunit ribosomal protein S35
MTRRALVAPSVRYFSVSPFKRAQEDPVAPPPPKELTLEEFPPVPEYSPDLMTKELRSMYDLMSPEERADFDAENTRMVAEFNDPAKRIAAFALIEKELQQIDKAEDLRFEDIRPRTPGFWAEDDPDEMAQVEDGDEEVNDDEITSMAHTEMELHREMREYARITAWDMPMLSSKINYSGQSSLSIANLKLQSSPNPSPCLPPTTFSDSATPPTWVNSTPPSLRSSWNSPPKI